MRYYDFKLEGAPNGGWSTHPGGRFDYAAPLLEMDISIGAADQHGTLGNVTIWGISIDTIKQSKNFYNKKFSLSAGMAPGLPLEAGRGEVRGAGVQQRPASRAGGRALAGCSREQAPTVYAVWAAARRRHKRFTWWD